jgi:hypothetical protein
MSHDEFADKTQVEPLQCHFIMRGDGLLRDRPMDGDIPNKARRVRLRSYRPRQSWRQLMTIALRHTRWSAVG